jgi:hypothetical protein
MSQLKNSAASLFSFEKTYAEHPVWKDSARAPARFAALADNRADARRAAARRFHDARRFERQTRKAGCQDGKLGRNGLAILQAMLFDFMNHRTGRLDPSYEALARAANISIRSVARGLAKLRAAKVISWIRRVYEKEIGGAWRMAQDTNAYAIAPQTQWSGFRAQPPSPPPDPDAWGARPPLPGALELAAENLRDGLPRAAQSALESDPGNELAGALASLGRRLGK